MRKTFSVAVFIVSLLLPMTAVPHHSFSLEFDVSRPVELTGTLVRFQAVNPHSWLYMEVEDDQGNVENWAVELLGIGSLVRSGMTPQTVKPGDVLSIKGFGARDGSNTANASLVTRTDTGEELWAAQGRN